MYKDDNIMNEMYILHVSGCTTDLYIGIYIDKYNNYNPR